MLIGLAAAIKLIPAVLIAWLLLKRRWRAVAAAVVTIAVVDLAPSLIAFGTNETIASHRGWVRQSLVGASGLSLIHERDHAWIREHYAHFLDYRNQGLAVVLGRLLGAIEPVRGRPQVTIAHLPTQAVAGLYVAMTAMSVVALAWVSRRSARRMTAEAIAAEAALWMIAMMWLSPLMRQYYLIWAYPAVAVLIARSEAGRRLARPTAVALVGVCAWLAGMLLWLWPHARACGADLWMLLAMGIVLAIESRRDRDAEPEALT